MRLRLVLCARPCFIGPSRSCFLETTNADTRMSRYTFHKQWINGRTYALPSDPCRNSAALSQKISLLQSVTQWQSQLDRRAREMSVEQLRTGASSVDLQNTVSDFQVSLNDVLMFVSTLMSCTDISSIFKKRLGQPGADLVDEINHCADTTRHECRHHPLIFVPCCQMALYQKDDGQRKRQARHIIFPIIVL